MQVHFDQDLIESSSKWCDINVLIGDDHNYILNKFL